MIKQYNAINGFLEKFKNLNKPFLYIVLIAILFSFLGMSTDINYIKDVSLIPYYIYGRIVFGLLNVVLLILFYNNVSLDKLVISFLIIMMAYSVHGQFFVPCYYLAYIEILSAVGLFFPIDKVYYRAIVVISMILLSLVVLFGSATYATEPLLIDKFKYDSISVIFVVSFGCIVGHTYITLARKEKDELYHKFIDIGKNSAFILHDFKGMMSTPLVYTTILREKIKQNDSEKAMITIDKLHADLKEIERFTKEINRLTLPNTVNKMETFNCEQIVSSLNILLSKYLDDTVIICKDNHTITSEYGLILKIVYNLAINSINEFKINRKTEQVIEISFTKTEILYRDNGIGYPEELIKQLNASRMNYKTQNGSGLGLHIISGIASELNMRLKFYNDNGACVRIKL